MKNKLHFREFTVKYDRKFIINNFDHTVNSPSIISLIGNNGAGKSSLLHSIAGNITNSNNSILFNNINIKDTINLDISCVFTQRIDIYNCTTNDFIDINNRKYKDINKKQHYIVKFGIESLLQKKINSLSDGQYKMVSLCRAFIQDSPILLLDEPLVYLDNDNIETIKQIILEEKEKIIFISSHNLSFSNEISDEIWKIENNTIFTYKLIQYNYINYEFHR